MTETLDVRLLGSDGSITLSGSWLAYWLVLLRLTTGWWMLHAGLDKFANWPFDASWFVGGAAQGTVIGPFVTVFSDGVLLQFTNVAVPVGQVLIGLGLVLGCLTRLAAFFGGFLMLFFYVINGQTGAWAHGLVTGELLAIMIFGTIITLGAGGVLSVDRYLADTDIVQNHPRLQYLVG